MRRLIHLTLILLLSHSLPHTWARAASALTQGMVTDRAGRPIGGAQVEVYELGAGLVAVLSTDDAGRYRIARPAGRGAAWQLRVSARGYRVHETGWHYPSQQPYQAIRLQPLSGSLTVLAQTLNGESIDGAVYLVGPGGMVLETAETLAGEYSRTDLPAGDYQVVLISPGRAPEMQAVTVHPGHTSFALLTVSQSAARLTGEVRDAITGSPIEGSTVELVTADHDLVALDRTGYDGRFEIPSAASGTLRLRVSAPGYSPAASAEFEADAATLLDWSGAGGLALEPAAMTVIGTVLDRAGEPRKGAAVTIEMKGYGEVRQAVTGGKGEFRVTDLPGGADRALRFLAAWNDGFAESGWLTLEQPVSQVLLQGQGLPMTSFSTGAVSGLVLSPTGSPVAGAKVELLRAQKTMLSAVTDENGMFLFREAAATRTDHYESIPYTMRISKEGFVPTRQIRVSGEERTDLHVASRARVLVQAVLAPAAQALRGRVLSESGEPIEDAAVRLIADGRPVGPEARTDRLGWYAIAQNATDPGRAHSLSVEAPGYSVKRGIDVSGNVREGTAFPTVRLKESGGAVAGQVLDFSGKPLGGAHVRVIGRGGQVLAEAATDERGRYRLAASVPVREQVLIVAGLDGWSSRLVTAKVPPRPGSALELDFALRPADIQVEGAVLEQAGYPLSGVTVELLEEGRGVVASQTTGVGGRYSFQVRPGCTQWFWLRVRPPEGMFAGEWSSRTDMLPMLLLPPGSEIQLDLLVRR